MSLDDLNKIFDARSSVRLFTRQDVELEKLFLLCKYAVKAPTACNMQQWRFTIITDNQLKRKIVDAGGSKLIASSPAGILVSYAKDTKNVIYKDNIQSAAAAVENILLAAPQMGLGACWICNLPLKRTLRKLINIHNRFDPVAYVIVGYPVKHVKAMPLKVNMDDIVAENRFPALEADKAYSGVKTFILRCAALGYRCAPQWLRKLFLNELIDKKFTKKFDKDNEFSQKN